MSFFYRHIMSNGYKIISKIQWSFFYRQVMRNASFIALSITFCEVQKSTRFVKKLSIFFETDYVKMSQNVWKWWKTSRNILLRTKRLCAFLKDLRKCFSSVNRHVCYSFQTFLRIYSDIISIPSWVHAITGVWIRIWIYVRSWGPPHINPT